MISEKIFDRLRRQSIYLPSTAKADSEARLCVSKDKGIKIQREDLPLPAADEPRAEQHCQDHRARFRDTGETEPRVGVFIRGEE